MEKKSVAIGAAVMAAAGAAYKFFKKRPMTAEELAKERFNPLTADYTHPFYSTWASVEENLESLNTLCIKFYKYTMQNVKNTGTPFAELGEREQILISISSLRDFINDAIQFYPDLCDKIIGEDESEYEKNDYDGSLILTDPNGAKDPKTMSVEQLAEQKATLNAIYKNRRLMSKAKRTMASQIVHFLKHDKTTAEITAKLLSGKDFKIDDLEDRDLKNMWAAIMKEIHALTLGAPGKVREKVAQNCLNSLPRA